MVFHRAVIHDQELKPVMRNLNQGAGNGGIAVALDGFAVGKELIPGIVRARNRNAAVIQNRLVDEHVLPVAVGGHRILLAVGCNRQHAVAHVGRIVGIFGADFFNRDHLVGLDERLGIGIGEEEKDIGLRAGFKIGQNLRLPLLVRGGGAIVDFVARGCLIGLDSGFKVAAVSVIAAVGCDNVQCHAVGVGDCAETQCHDQRQKQSKCFFHDCILLLCVFSYSVTFFKCLCFHYRGVPKKA